MDDFISRLRALDPGDQSGLLEVIRERASVLSGQSDELHDRLAAQASARESLAERLASVEDRIVEQADAAVEADVDSIEDLETLPDDVEIAFDPELIAEVEALQEATTESALDAAEGESMARDALDDAAAELEMLGDVVDGLESGEMDVAAAREHIISFHAERVEDDGSEGPA